MCLCSMIGLFSIPEVANWYSRVSGYEVISSPSNEGDFSRAIAAELRRSSVHEGNRSSSEERDIINDTTHDTIHGITDPLKLEHMLVPSPAIQSSISDDMISGNVSTTESSIQSNFFPLDVSDYVGIIMQCSDEQSCYAIATKVENFSAKVSRYVINMFLKLPGGYVMISSSNGDIFHSQSQQTDVKVCFLRGDVPLEFLGLCKKNIFHSRLKLMMQLCFRK